MVALCFHCKLRAVVRINIRTGKQCRGLCPACYADPEVRRLYLCLHCHKNLRRKTRGGVRCGSRGLCRTCYYVPEVRERYPRLRNTIDEDVVWTPERLPAEATEARPGSEDKIRIIQERLARGESLFGPRDVQIDLS